MADCSYRSEADRDHSYRSEAGRDRPNDRDDRGARRDLQDPRDVKTAGTTRPRIHAADTNLARTGTEATTAPTARTGGGETGTPTVSAGNRTMTTTAVVAAPRTAS